MKAPRFDSTSACHYVSYVHVLGSQLYRLSSLEVLTGGCLRIVHRLCRSISQSYGLPSTELIVDNLWRAQWLCNRVVLFIGRRRGSFSGPLMSWEVGKYISSVELWSGGLLEGVKKTLVGVVSKGLEQVWCQLQWGEMIALCNDAVGVRAADKR